jgi:hypothetical protein
LKEVRQRDERGALLLVLRDQRLDLGKQAGIERIERVPGARRVWRPIADAGTGRGTRARERLDAGRAVGVDAHRKPAS